jgi:hypothetical protein
MNDLYEADVLLWSEQQAALLRRMGAGDRVNDQVDWENVAEEIESVGRSQLSAVRSHIVQALLHDLKAEAWPVAREAPHWRSEARRARLDAAEAYVPSMHQRINLAELYAKALRIMPETIDGTPPRPVPAQCPVTLDELLADEP